LSIGERIKSARKAKGLTQPAFADLMDKTTRIIQSYEYGDVMPSLDVIEKISDVLDIPIWQLLGEHWKKKNPEVIQNVPGLEALIDYLHSIGYISKCIQKDKNKNKFSIELIKDGKTTTFTSDEFTVFEREIKESVEFKLWQKQKE
jgi:transcriptional regulator with XRE-family HTH domain